MSWRSSCGNRRSLGHPLVLSNYLEAQANLPYVDDSAAESPISEDNVVGLASHFLDAPAGGLASLTGLTSLNTLAVNNGAGDYYNPGYSAVHWPTTDRDDVISLMTGMRSRQNSYCSHGSRWSYSSHVEQSLGNLRSASRLDSSTGGTRSCRNSLLATAAHAAFPSACHQCGEIPPVATVAVYRKMPVSGLQIMSYVYSMSPFKIEFDLTDDDF